MVWSEGTLNDDIHRMVAEPKNSTNAAQNTAKVFTPCLWAATKRFNCIQTRIITKTRFL
jgi:hypothetical protein